MPSEITIGGSKFSFSFSHLRFFFRCSFFFTVQCFFFFTVHVFFCFAVEFFFSHFSFFTVQRVEIGWLLILMQIVVLET